MSSCRAMSYSIYVRKPKVRWKCTVSNPDQKVKFNHYEETGSSGVKGRVRSYSIYKENLKLVGSVQSLKSQVPAERVLSTTSAPNLLTPGLQQ